MTSSTHMWVYTHRDRERQRQRGCALLIPSHCRNVTGGRSVRWGTKKKENPKRQKLGKQCEALECQGRKVPTLGTTIILSSLCDLLLIFYPHHLSLKWRNFYPRAISTGTGPLSSHHTLFEKTFPFGVFCGFWILINRFGQQSFSPRVVMGVLSRDGEPSPWQFPWRSVGVGTRQRFIYKSIGPSLRKQNGTSFKY